METTEEGSKGGKRSHNFSLRFEGRQVKLDGPHCLPQSVCSSLNQKAFLQKRLKNHEKSVLVPSLINLQKHEGSWGKGQLGCETVSLLMPCLNLFCVCVF